MSASRTSQRFQKTLFFTTLVCLAAACDSQPLEPALSPYVAAPERAAIELVVGDSILLPGSSQTGPALSLISGGSSASVVDINVSTKGQYTVVRLAGSVEFDPRKIEESSVTLSNGDASAPLATRSDGSFIKVTHGGAHPDVTFYFVTARLSAGTSLDPAGLVFEATHSEKGLVRGVVGGVASRDDSSNGGTTAGLVVDINVSKSGQYTLVRLPGSPAFDPRKIQETSVKLTYNGATAPLATRPGGSFIKVTHGGAYPDVTFYFVTAKLGTGGAELDESALVFEATHADGGLVRGVVGGGEASTSPEETPSTSPEEAPVEQDTWRSSAPEVVSVSPQGMAVARGVGDALVTHGTTANQDTFYIRTKASTEAVEPTVPDADWRSSLVTYPNEAVAFIAGPSLKLGSALNPYAWYDETALAKGPVHAAAALNPATSWDQLSGYVMYYDLGLTLYHLYYRTGDEQYRLLARQVVDKWVGRLQAQTNPYNVAPRSVNLAGIMLRALDGRPELWDYALGYVRAKYPEWLGRHLGDHKLWYGVRDGGFMLLYAAQLGAAHPDPAIRTEMRKNALDAATKYYARLQQADGGWYYNVAKVDHRVSQPFQVGLMIEGLIATHRLTKDATVAETIIRGTDWLYQYGYDRLEPYKAMWYFVDEAHNGTGHGPKSVIWNERQLNSTTIHAFGYAYHLTGDEKYRQQGDDVLEATFNFDPAHNRGSTGLAAYRGKEYNQSYRSSGAYLAWRLGL